ncbi:MAG: glycosyltransferase family 4 protein [Candidatus Sumerlaeaceae bacterium]|nr:glycosyltransferase family 4 protein [Candidatus Sumerlaeaceae bacterium]
MKICMIVRALPAHRLGGLEYHTRDLVCALAARGHEVTVVTTPPPPGGAPVGADLAPGVEVAVVAGAPSADYSLSFWRALEPLVSRLHSSKRFDIVHAQEFAGLFLRPRGAALVCTVHGTMFTEVPLDRRYWRRLGTGDRLRTVWRYKARLALHPFFRVMLRRADRLLVDSQFTFRELARMDGALRPRMGIVPLGVDPARYPFAGIARSPRHPAAPPVIALLGRLQEMKGAGMAVEAARLLRSRGVRFRMEIGGSGPFAAPLQQRIDAAGLAGEVILRGRIAPDATSEFLAAADLFLFPDLTQPAFGLVAVEAMLHGLPVVAARCGALPETVTPETGWLYDPWKPVELADVLEQALADRAGLAARAAAARHRAAGFTAAAMAEQTEAQYEKVLGRLSRDAREETNPDPA